MNMERHPQIWKIMDMVNHIRRILSKSKPGHNDDPEKVDEKNQERKEDYKPPKDKNPENKIAH